MNLGKYFLLNKVLTFHNLNKNSIDIIATFKILLSDYFLLETTLSPFSLLPFMYGFDISRQETLGFALILPVIKK